MCESGNAGESRVFSRACIFTRRVYFTCVACIFTHFEDVNALTRTKPDLDTLETINEYSKKFHHGSAQPIDADELHRFVARILSPAGGCRGAA